MASLMDGGITAFVVFMQSVCNLDHYKTLIPGPWSPLNRAMGHFLKDLNLPLEISVFNTLFYKLEVVL